MHEGQTDKAGQPYVEHLERVAQRTDELAREIRLHSHDRDIAVQIAWLHDILERDPRPYGLVTIEDLRAEGFVGEVCAAASLLSGEFWRGMVGPSPSYQEKIDQIIIMGRGHADIVKLADLEDNLDPERVAKLPEPQRSSLPPRYMKAHAKISAALAGRRDAVTER